MDHEKISGNLRRAFWVSLTGVAVISILDLIGWMTGISWFKSAGPSWEPMRIITAICFILTVVALLTLYLRKTGKLKMMVPIASGVFLFMISSLTFSAWIYLKGTGNESPVSGIPVLELFLSPPQRMALFTSILFFFIAIILFLLTSPKPSLSDAAHILALPAAIAGYLVPVSYLFGVDITEFLGVSVALNSGIAFCAIFIAVFTMRPKTWLMSVFTSRQSGGIMVRRLLPWLVLLPLIIGYFRIYGEYKRFFSSEVGVLLVALTYTTCFIILVWFTGRSVNRIDLKRYIADEALKRSYEKLEDKVRERTAELMSLNKKLDDEIRERTNAEALVQSERKRFDGILEMLPAYLILLTPDYRVAYANRFFRERFGTSQGRRCHEFLFNRGEPCEDCETYKVLKDNKPHYWDWTGPDGHIYSISDFLYTDSDGSPLIMEMGIDITSLKEAEANLVLLNARLEQIVAERTTSLMTVNERLSILSDTSGSLLGSNNPRELINSLSVRVMNFLGCQFFFNYLIDNNQQKLVLDGYSGIPGETAERIKWLDFGTSICGCVARDGTTLVAEDIMNNSDPETSLARSLGIKAYACHPLLSHGKTIGTLSFGTSTREHFREDDLSLMKTVAEMVAVALTRIMDEEQVCKSEERYRKLMENSPSACLVNRDNRIVLLNPAAQKLLGIESVEMVLGKSPMRFFRTDFHPEIFASIGKSTNGGNTPKLEEKLVTADGVERDIEVVSVELIDSDGPAIQVILNDITERKKAEKELSDTKNYLQNLIDYANAPIIVWDQANKIRLFNHAFEHLTGYIASEVEGKNLEMLFPDETLKESMAKIRQALTENWITIEVPILTKSKEVRIILWNSARIFDENRNTISTIAQGNDITERIKAEQAFKESREKLEIALENGRIGTWEWEIEKDVFRWDERMERMFGVETGSFENTFEAFEKIINEEDRPHVTNAINLALKENTPLDTIYRIKTGNNGANYISTKALVERDNKGNPVKMAGVCFDITEMKQGVERALFALNEELLRSNKDLEQFAYVASHDLQEPLRMVSSFTQLLAQRYGEKLDQNAREFIQYAVDGAAHMQILINDLLNYSRIETKGKKFARVNMQAVMDQVKVNLELKIHEKKAHIACDKLPDIVADEGQMIQLFQNLILNSLKFCKTTPNINISGCIDTDHYLFSVRDNGIGIESKYYERIFQIFQRLHTREEYGGTGIGLPICRRIVERHNGRIWVESKPGKGSIFYFTIKKLDTGGICP